MSERLTITAYSTALFSTWIFVDPWGLLLDAGDGVCAGLLSKARKIKKVAITHADRDHLTGLLQLQQLNARDGIPDILYPKDCGSFPALREFLEKFDPDTGGKLTWTPVWPGQVVEFGKDLRIQVVESRHLPETGEQVKCVGYKVVRSTRKLRPEFQGVAQEDLARMGRERGSASLTFEVESPVLGYAGDTTVGHPEPWARCQVLIHEATFLNHQDAGDQVHRRNQHSVLSDVLAMARDANPGTLILNHFSSRYEKKEIVEAVKNGAREFGLNMPVHVIPPGEVVRDILGSEAFG